MEQLRLTYFFPLTEQIPLDLDYTPCIKFQEEKYAKTTIGNLTAGTVLSCNANGNIGWTSSVVMNDPKIIVYPDSQPITFRTVKKPNILTRIVYRALGVKWEPAC